MFKSEFIQHYELAGYTFMESSQNAKPKSFYDYGDHLLIFEMSGDVHSIIFKDDPSQTFDRIESAKVRDQEIPEIDYVDDIHTVNHVCWTISQAAHRLRLSSWEVYCMIADPDFDFPVAVDRHRIGIPMDELSAWMEGSYSTTGTAA